MPAMKRPHDNGAKVRELTRAMEGAEHMGKIRIAELAELQRQLDAESRAHAATMAKLEEADSLRAKLSELAAEMTKAVAAEKTSVEFWIYEANRWRKEAEELRRAEAVARVDKGER